MTNSSKEQVSRTSDDGGAGTRPRRSLSESMIAGRRKPGEPSRAGAASPARAARPVEPAPAPTVRRRRAAAPEAEPEAAPRRRATRAVEPPAEEQPAEAPPRAPRARGSRGGVRSRAGASAAAMPETMTDAAPEVSLAGTPPPEALVMPPVTELPPLAPVAPLPPGDMGALTAEVTRLRGFVEQQRTVLAELRAGVLTLGQQVDRSGYRPRLGVFVDVPNLMYGVESSKQVHMGRLLDMLRDGRQLVRATAYSPVSDDPRESIEQQKFVAPFVAYDYRIVTKSLKRFADGSIKGNFDVEMAIDMVSMAGRVDIIAIVSGDADFSRAVEAVQSQGVRVEVVAFAGSTSLEMRALADHYLELGTVANRILF